MSGWLAVADRLLGRRARAQPSSYEIECACGRKVSGERTDSDQVTFCVACGTALFILPRSIYPRSKGSPGAPTRAPAAKIPPKRPRATNSADGPERSPAIPAKTREAAAPRDRAPDRKPEPAERLGGGRPRRKLLTPVRLILAGVVAVIALTVWGSLRVSARNEAERTIVASVKLAEQALAENDLGEAARRFQEVRQALDILGRTDAHARELRQTAAEITASAELTRSSLFDILHEAVTTMARSGPAMWNDTFRSSYRDEWVLIDANVSRNPAGSNRQKFEIDYPLSSGSDRAQLVGDLPFFEQVVQGGSPQRVIFAAQLEDFSRSPNTEVTWQVVLRPGTAFLWTAPANLERLGLELDDETRSVLERQGNLVGGYQ